MRNSISFIENVVTAEEQYNINQDLDNRVSTLFLFKSIRILKRKRYFLVIFKENLAQFKPFTYKIHKIILYVLELFMTCWR